MPVKKKYLQEVFDNAQFPVRITRTTGTGFNISSYQNHYHAAELEIQFIRRGTGYYFIKDRRYPVKPASALVIHSYEIHHFFTLDEKPFIDKTSIILYPTIFNKSFLAEHLGYLITCRKNFPHQVFFSQGEFSIIEFLLTLAHGEITHRRKFWQEIAIDCIEQIFLLLLRRIEEGGKQNAEEINEIVRSAINYIEENFMQPMTLKQLSRMFNISTFHMSHLFTRYAGISFKSYLIKRRIEEAKKLLHGTDLKISAVCRQCGFSDESSFIKTFKKLTGTSPTSHRKIFQYISKKNLE
ncbi:MAG: AraC family transcriptional regulator [bacterium]|nr:AraC family transcriptional regulator [bacterium]